MKRRYETRCPQKMRGHMGLPEELGGGGQFISLFPRFSSDPALPKIAPSPNIIMDGECSGSKQHPVKNHSKLLWCKVESISCRPDQNATGDCFNSTSLYFSPKGINTQYITKLK